MLGHLLGRQFGFFKNKLPTAAAVTKEQLIFKTSEDNKKQSQLEKDLNLHIKLD